MKKFAIAFGFLAAASAAWAQDGSHRVVVGFNGPADETVFAQNGGQSFRKLKGSNAVVGTLPVGKIEKVKSLANVAYVEPDLVASIVQGRASGKPQPPPPVQPAEQVPWGVDKIGAVNLPFTGTGITVGIVDTGIDKTHPDLAQNILGGINTIGILAPSANFGDDNDHGTHVAGTIAGIDNDIGVVGVAPGAKLYVAKALNKRGSGNYSDLAEAINYCVAAQVRVISMSWGGSGSSQTLQDAIDNAAAAQVVLVAASGNSGNGAPIGYPAAYLSVLAIGATDVNDALASFTSTGLNGLTPETQNGVDLLAPGVGVLSTVRGGKYATFNGTSMATPHVAAVAALIIESQGYTQKADVESRLTSTAVPVSAGLRVSASAATALTP